MKVSLLPLFLSSLLEQGSESGKVLSVENESKLNMFFLCRTISDTGGDSWFS